MDVVTPNVKMEVNMNGSGRVMAYDMLLRTMAFCFTLVAAVVAGTDYQTKNIPITLSDSLPTFSIAVTAKWHYLSSTV